MESQKFIINSIFTSNFSKEKLVVLEKTNKKDKRGEYYYRCKFLNSNNEYLFLKQNIISGKFEDSKLKEQEFLSGIYPQNCGDSLKVIEKSDKKQGSSYLYKCQFQKYPYEVFSKKEVIIGGNISNPMYPSICNKGYLGIGKYNTKNKSYFVWSCILNKCYNKSNSRFVLNKVSVYNSWFNFQNFAAWYEENYIEGYELDKDILFNVKHLNKRLYSPETCIFVPSSLNTFLAGDTLLTGITPLFKNRDNINQNLDIYYKASIFRKNKQIYLGIFDTFLEAKLAYAKKKYEFWLEEINKFKLPNDLKEILLQYDFSWSWLLI